MIKRTFDSFKKSFHSIIDPNHLKTPEDRRAKKAELMLLKKFPLKEIIDFWGTLYTMTDRKLKAGTMEFIEDLLTEVRHPGTCEAVLLLYRSTVDVEVRDSAMRVATALFDESLLPTVFLLLKSPKKQFRMAAMKFLENLPYEDIKKKLSAELLKGGWADWSDPLNFLFKIGPDEVLVPSRKALEIGNEDDKIQALKILTEIKSPEAVRSMEVAIDDESQKIRLQAARSFAQVGGTIAIRSLVRLLGDSKPDVVLAALDGLKTLRSPAGIPAVIACLKHENLAIRNHAINTIGEIGTADEVNLLISGLKDLDIRTRQGALEALISLSRKEGTDVTKFISVLMSDSDVNVRRAAAQIMGQVDAPGLFEKMFEYLRDEDWWVRETIAEMLSKIKDERIYPAAIELMTNADPSLRRYAIEILVGMDDKRALVPLIRMLKDPDWWVRERAVSALGSLGNAQIVPIISNLLNIKELSYVTAEALGQIGDASAIPHLLKALPDSDAETKIVILRSLEKLDACDTIPVIEKYLSDPVREVRTQAKEVLTRLKVDSQKLDDISTRWWEQHEFSLLDTLLMEVKYQNGSDLFLVSNDPPMARVRNDLMPLSKERLSEEQIMAMTSQILSPDQEKLFTEGHDLDFSYEIAEEGRFRGNMFRHSQGLNIVFRLLPEKIPSLDELNLPVFVKTIPRLHHGLILVSGPSSSGKSTTMAALIDAINEEETLHIITIEDPVEYVHSRKKSLITQREVGRHTTGFAKALRAALREDPDVIMVGELRDLNSISMALTAAETGHLVFATLHANSATKTVDRIVDAYPENQQSQIRSMLAESLKIILCQQLVPRKDGEGDVVAVEILINTPAIASLIRDNKTFQIPSMMTAGQQYGMVTIDQSLLNLVREKVISSEDAYSRAEDKNMFESLMNEEAE